MTARSERTKYEPSHYDEIPTMPKAVIAHVRRAFASHCPFPEPMFIVATFCAGISYGS
jgi:hypothetical protein